MSNSIFTHLEYATTQNFKVEIDAGSEPYFTLSIWHLDTPDGLHQQQIFFLRPDQLAELFYALREADDRWLIACLNCEGSGQVRNLETDETNPCKVCHGSGAVLKSNA
jgi:hypothetical protein